MLGAAVSDMQYRENIHPPPPALGPRVCIRVFCKTTLNCLEYSLQEKCLGWILCHFLW